MKKKLSVLLIGSLVAISLAGCSGSTSGPETTAVPSDNSVESSANGESSVSSDTSAKSESQTDGTSKTDGASKTENSKAQASNAESNGETSVQPSENASSEEEDIGPKEGDIIVDEDGNEFVYHEDSTENEPTGDNDDEDMPVTSDGKEEMPKFLDVTYTPIDGKDANIDKSSINMSSPVYYTVSSVDEMKDFVSKYGSTYSINDVESGVTFDTLAEKFDSNYFEVMSLVIIPIKYDSDSEPDIDTITAEGDDYTITVVAPAASSDENTNSMCLVVQVNNMERDNRNIVLDVIQDSMIAEGEEEGEEIIDEIFDEEDI